MAAQHRAEVPSKVVAEVVPSRAEVLPRGAQVLFKAAALLRVEDQPRVEVVQSKPRVLHAAVAPFRTGTPDNAVPVARDPVSVVHEIVPIRLVTIFAASRIVANAGIWNARTVRAMANAENQISEVRSTVKSVVTWIGKNVANATATARNSVPLIATETVPMETVPT